MAIKQNTLHGDRAFGQQPSDVAGFVAIATGDIEEGEGVVGFVATAAERGIVAVGGIVVQLVGKEAGMFAHVQHEALPTITERNSIMAMDSQSLQ